MEDYTKVSFIATKNTFSIYKDTKCIISRHIKATIYPLTNKMNTIEIPLKDLPREAIAAVCQLADLLKCTPSQAASLYLKHHSKKAS